MKETPPLIEALVASDRLKLFDQYFVRTLKHVDPGASKDVLLAAAFARQAIDNGHVCVDLASLADGESIREPPVHPQFPMPGLSEWLAGLKASPLVSGGGKTPLVLEDTRLYLNRYWRYETRLATEILRRAQASFTIHDEELLQKGLHRLLGEGRKNMGQRRAVETAVRRQFTVISGGPGTGKTTIVALILALLQEQALAGPAAPLRFILLAPTGKAAARLSQALRQKNNSLPLSKEIRNLLPTEAATIHRALGFQSRTPTIFRFNRVNPLPADCLIVDEASMVDVALMAKLLEAAPAAAKVVLLGDKDQLASVEAGSIMGDICLAAEQGRRDGQEADLSRCVVQLDRSYRFDADHGIGALVKAVNSGDGEGAVALLESVTPHVQLLPLDEDPLANRALRRLIVEGYRDALSAAGPQEALCLLDRFRLLCVHRHGPAGVEQLNALCRRILADEGLIHEEGEWFKGRPVMITANHYKERLFNGDIGIAWPQNQGQPELLVFFLDLQGPGLRAFSPWRLPAHETAFAMTVHKSQGSEFEELALYLPHEMSPVLTRELLYTALSRARTTVTLFGATRIIKEAVERKVERASGLGDRLVAGSAPATP